MNLNDSIECIKNIGNQRTEKFNKLGVFTIEDLIEYYPRDYEDRSDIKNISSLIINSVNTFKGIIKNKPENISFNNLKLTKAKIIDNTGSIECVWFNQPYLKNSIKLKTKYIFTGKVIEKNGKVQVESPDYEIIGEKESLSNGRIIPIYSSTYKLSQKIFRTAIKEALEVSNNQIKEFFPVKLKETYNLADKKFAINNIHFPKNKDSFFQARKRLVFEELFLMQLKLFQLKGNIKDKKSNIHFDNYNISKFFEILPFKLTNAQKKVIDEIISDFKSGLVMNRLIQGDVGSGKTVVAMAASFISIINGYQTALMVPTDVLANQHYKTFKEMFDCIGLNCILLSGKIKAKDKKIIYEQIESGKANMIIGTHALIQDNVIFNKLGLVITDEQHRFGVSQRMSLSLKGDNPHVLVMTATPIPRTLALILYGDLDISIIDTLPPGRQKIDTIFVNSSYYNRIYNFIKKEAEKGNQIYIICPVIDNNDNKELKDVLSYTKELKENVFFNYSVEFIHGKLKSDEKQDIMQKFSDGKIDILVSTTVIEVGINVPKATIMLIENAERFGLSQLHQLRGRVGRGSDKSYCILICDSKSKTTKERLKIMTESNDGFVISEKDLSLRGPGDFFGTRQHGLPDFKIANLYKDIDILKTAQNAAIQIYKQDPFLKNDENVDLSKKINQFYSKINRKISL